MDTKLKQVHRYKLNPEVGTVNEAKKHSYTGGAAGSELQRSIAAAAFVIILFF